MKIKPVLFSTEMVQAILDNRKTMTRRICKRQPLSHQVYTNYKDGTFNINGPDFDSNDIKCPYGSIGDVLWVRETFAIDYVEFSTSQKIIHYSFKASLDEKPADGWKPSLFMPKEACRIFLKITNIRVERLCDISDQDALSEGIDNFTWKDMAKPQNYLDYSDPNGPPLFSPYDSFITLWDKINGIESTDSNPWVWVIEFERCDKPENFLS